jgi:hypothetical protein
VGALEQTVGEAVLPVRLGVAEHAFLEAGNRVEQRQCRQFPPGQHEVAEAELTIDVPVDETLVDALVAAAQQDRTWPGGEVVDDPLVDALAGRREVHQGHRLLVAPFGPDRCQCALQRLVQHHHAGSAAIGPVVDAAVRTLPEVAQGPGANLHPSFVERAAGDALGQRDREQIREQRDDVEAHRSSTQKSAPQSTVMRRPARSTVST